MSSLRLEHGESPGGATSGASAVLPGGRPHVCYFVNVFPTFIETMIYREVGALRSLGYTVSVFSIRRPNASDIPLEAQEFVEGTFYILPVRLLRLVKAHARALARHPIRYWSILFEVVNGTHTRFRDRLRSLCHFAEGVTVLQHLKRLEVDHLHAHWAVGSATCAMVVSRFLNIPFSFTAHAYDIWRDRLLLAAKLVAAWFAVTCTAANRRHLVGAYGADPARIHVVHHGLDVSAFRPQQRVANPEPVILSVGRLVEQKGFDRLLRACATLAAEGQQFRCEIVGHGPLHDELEGLARQLKIADRVQFRGRMSQSDLALYYARADLFALICVPASDEDRDGIPNTAIEAMAMELPVVSTRFSGLPELVVDGETGLLVETNDQPALVTALSVLLKDPARRRRMGRAGRKRVCTAFTIDKSAAKIDALFSGREITCGPSGLRESGMTDATLQSHEPDARRVARVEPF